MPSSARAVEPGRPGALVCLGAGKSQLLVLRKARELGYAVIAVDRDSSAPGFELCDLKLELSTHDPAPIIEALARAAREFRLLGVVNRSAGPPVVTAAAICQAFGLPGVTQEAARTAVDKGRLMAFCQAQGIPAPRCQSVGSYHDLALEEILYPCIVKPSLSLVGKGGVRRVEREGELQAAFRNAACHAFNGLVNVEEFVEGDDVSLLTFVWRGKLYPLVLLDEINGIDPGGNHFGEGFAVPSRHWGGAAQARFVDAAGRIAAGLGLDTTALLVSMRIGPDLVPRVIETHLDLGGDRILDTLLPGSSDFDFVRLFVAGVAGDFAPPPPLYFKPVKVIYEQGEGLLTNRGFALIET